MYAMSPADKLSITRCLSIEVGEIERPGGEGDGPGNGVDGWAREAV